MAEPIPFASSAPVANDIAPIAAFAATFRVADTIVPGTPPTAAIPRGAPIHPGRFAHSIDFIADTGLYKPKSVSMVALAPRAVFTMKEPTFLVDVWE